MQQAIKLSIDGQINAQNLKKGKKITILFVAYIKGHASYETQIIFCHKTSVAW